MENYQERPVQKTLVELLLLPRDNPRFTATILMHGMGGTGKVSGLFPDALIFRLLCCF